jgi:hypothetical protein
MNRNWAGWTVGLIFLATLALTVYEYVHGMAAFRSGQSPLAAVQATQQRVFHIMANPWIFSAYLVLLVVLLVPVVRQISSETRSTNDYWFLAALLAAIVTLVRNFVLFH